jgi:hypothetical protein
MGVLSQRTATDIALAHREIEMASKLLAEAKYAEKWNTQLDLRDAFGRQRGLELCVPSGRDGHRMYALSPDLAKYVIEAHVEKTKARLAELCVIARMELDGVVAMEAPANG